MTPEEKALLERVAKLSEENNDILRSMRRSNRFTNIMRIFYWVIILLVGFGSYYFIQPYVNTMMNLLNGGAGSLDLGGIKSQTDLLNSLLK